MILSPRRWTAAEVLAFRRRFNLTQEKVAKELGANFHSISRWERSIDTPEPQHPSPMASRLLTILEDRLVKREKRESRRETHARL